MFRRRRNSSFRNRSNGTQRRRLHQDPGRLVCSAVPDCKSARRRSDFFRPHAELSAVRRKVLARKIAAYGFVLLVVSALFGSEILAFFGISLFVVQIAGGLVVAATGWKLLNQPDDDSSSKQVPGTLEDALQHAFFPLTLPLTVGPGAISIAITLGAHLRYQAGPGFEHGYPRHFIAAAAGMLLVCLLVVVCYGNAADWWVARQIRHQRSDAPFRIYPSSHRRSNLLEWPQCRDTANACSYNCCSLRILRGEAGADACRRLQRSLSWFSFRVSGALGTRIG